MTRKEQIEQAGKKINLGKCHRQFMLGAQWADEHPHWVSVEDELPPADDRDDESDDCLIVEEDGNIDIGYYNQMDETWFTCDGGIRAITHWMPLPSTETIIKK